MSRYREYCDYWTRHPPVHRLVAAWMEYKPPFKMPTNAVGTKTVSGEIPPRVITADEGMGVEAFAAFVQATGGRIPGISNG